MRIDNEPRPACPHCNSLDTKFSGTRNSPITGKYRQYQCGKCYKYFNENTIERMKRGKNSGK